MKEVNFKKLWDVSSNIILTIYILLAMLLTCVQFIGLQPLVVVSGSMEPSYPIGSLVYVKKIDTNKLKIGDVITVQLTEDVTGTHRIVDIITDSNDPSVLRFQTKGDANPVIDDILFEDNDIIGKVIFMIPYLGYIANFIHTPFGLCIFAIPALFALFYFQVEDAAKKKALETKESDNEALSQDICDTSEKVIPVEQDNTKSLLVFDGIQ